MSQLCSNYYDGDRAPTRNETKPRNALQRTAEGRERAKARGVRLGRKPKLTAHQQQEARRRRDSGKETLADIARSYSVSHSTISRLAA